MTATRFFSPQKSPLQIVNDLDKSVPQLPKETPEAYQARLVKTIDLANKTSDHNDQEYHAFETMNNILIGSLAAGFATVLGYYFGSSEGSRNKDAIINSLTPGLSSVNPPDDNNLSSNSYNGGNSPPTQNIHVYHPAGGDTEAQIIRNQEKPGSTTKQVITTQDTQKDIPNSNITTIQQVIDRNLTIKITNTSSELLKQIQTKLKELNYYDSKVDGIYGTKTQEAWAQFKADKHQTDPSIIGPGSLKLLLSDNTPRVMIVPQTAIDLIKEFEGFFTEAYPDDIQGWSVPTIGYGTIKYPNEQCVKRGDTCTETQAIDWLYWEVNSLCTPALIQIPTWHQMNDNQHSALYSFAYNLGADFYGSNGFNSITQLLKNPDQWKVSTEVYKIFELYINPRSSAEEGLRRRREAEAKLFLS